MGLDITAYSRLKHIGLHEKDPALNEGEPGGQNDYCYYENHVQAYAYDEFPQSFRGIPVLSSRPTSGGFTFLEGGCYETTEATQIHGFHAGSYTGYNRWRADLQRQFNPDRRQDGPFYELIWFADNEGAIGHEAAKDLHEDFVAHAERYTPEQHPNDTDGRVREDWLRRYRDWTRAFELAADGGLVDFH